MSRPLRARLLGLVAVTMVACAAPQSQAGPPAMAFGVLAASCEPVRVTALRHAGVTIVELPLAWDRYQPARDRVDAGYVAEIRSRITSCRDAGLGVVLAPGLQYPPSWVRALPSGTLRGSSGASPKGGGADLIFSAAVRDAAGDYLARLATDVGFNGVIAVRVGTTNTGELGYPGPDAGGNAREYWAFGAAAQHGVGLVKGMARSPLPGWVPGSARWDGRRVTAQQADAWWSWYTRSAVDAVLWQIERLRALGFAGRVHVPVAGRGVLPADRSRAMAGLLDGRADPDGALERGLDYPAQFAVLARSPNVDVDFTGLDDDTAVSARAASPAQDRCSPGDENDLLRRTDVASWSTQRFTTAVARRAGLGLVGENPGPPGAPSTGGSRWSDSLAAQLDFAPDYAAECGIGTFLFAFEDDLFNESKSGSSGVSLNDYAVRIVASKGRR